MDMGGGKKEEKNRQLKSAVTNSRGVLGGIFGEGGKKCNANYW